MLLGSYDLVGFVEILFSKNGQSYFHFRNGVSNSRRLLFDNFPRSSRSANQHDLYLVMDIERGMLWS